MFGIYLCKLVSFYDFVSAKAIELKIDFTVTVVVLRLEVKNKLKKRGDSFVFFTLWSFSEHQQRKHYKSNYDDNNYGCD